MTVAIPGDDDSSDDGEVEIPKIHPLLRWSAAALGGAGLTFGTLAVFITHVEAGPVALLAVGLVFAIIAIAGQVPWRIKFGDTEIELQKERKRRTKSDAAAVDLAAAIKPAEQPQALEVVERTQASNPELGAAMQSALGYEQMVMEMISRIIARKGATWVPPDQLLTTADTSKTSSFPAVLFDGLIARADGTTRRALVEIKATTRDVDARFINLLHDRFVRGVNQYGAEMLLLVTREPLTRTAGIRLAEFSDKRWVQVTGPVDEEALDKTIEQLIGKLYWET